MPTLSITKSYADGLTLTEADLDNVKDSVEDFINSTKLDNSNIQTGGINTANLADNAVSTAKVADEAITRAKIDDIDRIPVGSIQAFGGSSAPAGWLLCDGTAYNRVTYASLYTVVGTNFGNGDGSTTFNVPDTRGMFLRGFNNGKASGYYDPDATSRITFGLGGSTGDNIGSYQADENKAHTHVAQDQTYNSGAPLGAVNGLDAPGNTGSSGGNEARPRNISVNYIIKY